MRSSGVSAPRSIQELLRSDGLTRAAASVFALSLATIVAERLAPQGLAGRAAAYVDVVLLATTLAALVWGRGRLESRRERAFWDLLAVAWTCWLAVEFFYFFDISLPFVSASFATDAFYILHFLVYALAIDLRPHVRPARSLTALRRRLESAAGLVAFFGVLTYFGLEVQPEPLGLSLSFVSRDRGLVPLLLLRLSLDLFILARLLHAAFVAGGRWPLLYRLLAAAQLLLAIRDGLALLRYAGVLTAGWLGVASDLLLCLPGFLVMLAARQRFVPVDEVSEEPDPSQPAGREMSWPGLLAVYTLIVPVAHFLLFPLGLLESGTRTARDVLGLIYVLAVGSIAALHQLVLDRERRAAVESLKREIERRERMNRQLQLRQAETEQFNYTISHELQAPVVTIGGFVGLLEDGLNRQDRSQAAKDLDRIRDAASHMKRVLSELLELSRVGWRIEPVDDLAVGSVVGEALSRLEIKNEPREPRILIETALPTVRADAARLTDVFTNLIDNAVKFTPHDRRPVVRIGCRPGPRPAFYVADNGCGVAPRFHHKVFGLFDRLDPAVEGTGVGLALVKRIIEEHGGSIWLESAGVGRGSTFWFTLGRRRA